MSRDTIQTARLELVLLTPEFLTSWLAGEPTPDLGFSDPAGFLTGAEDVVRLRLAQLERDASIASWLLRAVVMRTDRVAVGGVGFHAAPLDGVAEIGYEIHSSFRRQGYASEASAGLIAWAAERGVRTVRACVAPGNEPSIALLAKQGFFSVGTQVDPEDGLELVLEKPI